MWIDNRKEFCKLTFRALVIRRFKHILSLSTKDPYIEGIYHAIFYLL